MEESLNDDNTKPFYEVIKITDIQGIGPKVEGQLNDIGIFSIADLAVADAEMVSTLGKMKKDTAISFILAANKLLRDRKEQVEEFCDANDVMERRKKVLKIRTGSNDLDKLLYGGIETMSLTEFYGAFGSGKSQLCHTLCVNTTLPIVHKGADSSSIYIDTEGTFRPERIAEIAESMGLDPIEVKKKIKYCQIANSSHLELIIRELGGYIEKYKPKLIIIDSIISLHKAEYVGRGMLAERQQKLNPMLHHLIKLAEIYNIAVVITNQVIANPDSSYKADPIVPSGGNIMAHVSTYRVYLRRSGRYRMARIIDSPYHPYSDIKFKVTEKGIEDLDAKEKESDSEE
jgi:DNA repair protein RadA